MTTNDTCIVDCDFCNPDHLRAVGNLINAYIKDEMGGGTPLTPFQQLRLVDGLNNHPTAIVLLAATNGEPSGLIVAFQNFSTFMAKPMVNIHDVFVSSDARGMGVGRMLMEALIEKAKELKCGRITLEVRHDNVVAQKLYNSLGFHDDEHPMYFWKKIL